MPLHSHRAPATPLRERGRAVMVTATLIGVGVAGATGDAALSHPRAVGSGPALPYAGPAAARAPATATATTTRQVTNQQVTNQQVISRPVGQRSGSRPAGAQSDDAGNPLAAGPVDAAYRPRHSTAPGGPTGRVPGYAPARRRVRPAPPSQWVSPLPEASVTSCFGQRWGRLHAGVDLAAPDGTRIRAAGAGTVVAAGVESGYGNAVLIDHGNGYLTHYGHLSAVTVLAGERVAAGAQIGNEGSTGHSTGPHLHFEVHEGTYKNPIEPTGWLHDHGVEIAGCAPSTGG